MPQKPSPLNLLIITYHALSPHSPPTSHPPPRFSLLQALINALPLGPQTPAGGITLPEAFRVRGGGSWGDNALHSLGLRFEGTHHTFEPSPSCLS